MPPPGQGGAKRGGGLGKGGVGQVLFIVAMFFLGVLVSQTVTRLASSLAKTSQGEAAPAQLPQQQQEAAHGNGAVGDTHDAARVAAKTAKPPAKRITPRSTPTSAPATEPVEDDSDAEHKHLGAEKHKGADGGGGGGHPEPTLIRDQHLLSAPMIDLEDTTLQDKCPDWPEKESSSNVAFMKEFRRIFKRLGLQWWLDEGGLIGSSRAGSMRQADDDFDFFCLLPNQLHPCRPDSLTCTNEEYHAFIHKFLMEFWNEGMCINKFHPDPKKFKSKMRLMYSFQLNRKPDVDPTKCFKESTPFAHMHLGMMTENGELFTNIWAVNSTHPRDRLPIRDILPVARCRAGPVDAPCPKNLTAYLTVRNRGEYRKYSSDGSCLLVRKKWPEHRKRSAVDRIKQLDKCGYNSIVDLVPPYEASGYKAC